MPKSQQQNEKIPSSPDPVKFEKDLLAIARARTRLAVCFWTLPVYVVAIWVLLNNGRSIDSMMWIYIAVYAVFAIDMSMRKCPICHGQFYVKNIFLNLLTKQCVHCGQTSSRSKPTPQD
jgi:hypothetical protein